MNLAGFRLPSALRHLRRVRTWVAFGLAVAAAFAIDFVVWRADPVRAYCAKAHVVSTFLDRECYREADEPGLYFEPLPDSPCFPFGQFPDKAHALVKPAGTTRVLVLGDSVTHNPRHAYVLPGKSFYELAEDALNRRGDGKWEMINGGVLSYNTVQERAYYRSRLRRWAPDVVVLQYLEFNDYEPPQIPEFHRDYRECVASAVPNPLHLGANAHQTLSLRVGVYSLALRGGYALLGRFDPVRFPPVFYRSGQPADWIAKNRAARGGLADDLEREGIPLLTLVFPILEGQIRDDPWMIQTAATPGQNQRFAFVSSALRAAGPLNSFRVEEIDQVHPNQAGHEIAGRVLADALAGLRRPAAVEEQRL
jgi:hypothetical protein